MKTYTVLINGLPHTMQLSDEDAKRYGDDAVEVKDGAAQNKGRSATNKGK